MTNKEIGASLQAARRKSGLRQKDVADKIGFSAGSMIALYEGGTKNFTADFLNRYCNAIGATWTFSIKLRKKSPTKTK